MKKFSSPSPHHCLYKAVIRSFNEESSALDSNSDRSTISSFNGILIIRAQFQTILDDSIYSSSYDMLVNSIIEHQFGLHI